MKLTKFKELLTNEITECQSYEELMTILKLSYEYTKEEFNENELQL